MRIYLTAVALCVIVAVAGEAADMDKKMTYQEFNATISSISKSITDLTTSSVLLTKSEFTSLSDKAAEYRIMAVRMLEEDAPDQEKQIAVYAMQRLSLQDYHAFIDQLLNSVREKRVHPNFLELALMPGFEWNTKLQDEWQSPKVRGQIENIKASRLLSADCDEYLDDILSGRGAEYVKRMRRDGEIP